MRESTIKRSALGLLLTGSMLSAPPASAVEYPIGQPQQRHGMEIGAVYLQPILMEPKGMMTNPEESDVHMEADIRALADNPNGCAEGAWIPYLQIKYEIAKEGSDR